MLMVNLSRWDLLKRPLQMTRATRHGCAMQLGPFRVHASLQNGAMCHTTADSSTAAQLFPPERSNVPGSGMTESQRLCHCHAGCGRARCSSALVVCKSLQVRGDSCVSLEEQELLLLPAGKPSPEKLGE
eukprot:2809200-Rhodomonas_salina.2